MGRKKFENQYREDIAKILEQNKDDKQKTVEAVVNYIMKKIGSVVASERTRHERGY